MPAPGVRVSYIELRGESRIEPTDNGDIKIMGWVCCHDSLAYASAMLRCPQSWVESISINRTGKIYGKGR
jgi:hypothetical protein